MRDSKTIMTKIGNQDVSIATFMDILQKIAGNQKKRRKPENAINVIK